MRASVVMLVLCACAGSRPLPVAPDEPPPATFTISVDVTMSDLDGNPGPAEQQGETLNVVEAVRPQIQACFGDTHKASYGRTVDVDATGHVRVPFYDHPAAPLACLDGVLGKLVFAPGQARRLWTRITYEDHGRKAFPKSAP